MNDLLPVARTWVIENNREQAQHLVKAEEWLRRIHPNASEAMLLATLTHDMERAFPGQDSPKQNPRLGPDDPVYTMAHSERSARIVSEFLEEQHVSEALITEVARLIRAHEIGGWEDANWVQAADSLSFLEVNVDFFLDKMDTPHGWSRDNVRAKFDWMYNRIGIPEAKTLAKPLYEEAIRKLHTKETNSSIEA